MGVGFLWEIPWKGHSFICTKEAILKMHSRSSVCSALPPERSRVQTMGGGFLPEWEEHVSDAPHLLRGFCWMVSHLV